jgi:hypothetical protein
VVVVQEVTAILLLAQVELLTQVVVVAQVQLPIQTFQAAAQAVQV